MIPDIEWYRVTYLARGQHVGSNTPRLTGSKISLPVLITADDRRVFVCFTSSRIFTALSRRSGENGNIRRKYDERGDRLSPE